MSAIIRVSLTFAVALAASAALATSAWAAPVWRVDAVSATEVEPGGVLRLFMEARNVGADPMDGSDITFAVTLPPGLTAQSAVTQRAGGAQCTAADGVSPVAGEHEIVCHNSRPLERQRWENLNIVAAVAPGFVGTLSTTFEVSGGGAATAGSIDHTQVGGTPQFGADLFDGAVMADESGTPFTQAGGHPYSISTDIEFKTYDNTAPLVDGPYPFESVKDVTVDLPPGMVGSPAGIAQCATADLTADGGSLAQPRCVPASQVGTTIVRFKNLAGTSSYGPLPVFSLDPAARRSSPLRLQRPGQPGGP